MFAATRTAFRLAVYATLFAVCASLVLATGITVVTVGQVVARVAANVVSPDPCAGRTMLIDQCAPLDTSHVTDLRAQAAPERNPR